jgi:energy-coupling factor transporter ATP-binding protein EcfA2
MNDSTLISGNNFSGRSERLKEILGKSNMGQRATYIGPYAETALSGFATYISEEIYIYHRDAPTLRNIDFFPERLLEREMQRISGLSGGEQVLLALYCFAGSQFSNVGIDTALEQLDPINREKIFSYLRNLRTEDRHFILIDNMLENNCNLSSNNISLLNDHLFPLAIAQFQDFIPTTAVPTIEIRNLDFSYNSSAKILESVSIVLNGGTGYRLRGDNGTGKSTFLKILTGVLPVKNNMLFVNGYSHRPSTDGNSIIALSMQNPDDQWAGTSIQKDIEYKLKALVRRLPNNVLTRNNLLETIPWFGLPKNSEYHLLDLPKALRKRLSWLWPLGGHLPWLAFDEPTIGQDQDAVRQLANVLNQLIRKGYGVIFITHNDNFAKLIDHKELLFKEKHIVEIAQIVNPTA